MNKATKCKQCEDALPLSTMSRRQLCIPCRERYQSNWRRKRIAADPTYLRREAANLRRQVLARTLKEYGLTQAQFDSLVEKGCAICGGPPNGRGRYHFDHDHKTDKFRGLLCTTCNSGLGHFRDSRDLLVRAVQYLAEHKE